MWWRLANLLHRWQLQLLPAPYLSRFAGDGKTPYIIWSSLLRLPKLHSWMFSPLQVLHRSLHHANSSSSLVDPAELLLSPLTVYQVSNVLFADLSMFLMSGLRPKRLPLYHTKASLLLIHHTTLSRCRATASTSCTNDASYIPIPANSQGWWVFTKSLVSFSISLESWLFYFAWRWEGKLRGRERMKSLHGTYCV